MSLRLRRQRRSVGCFTYPQTIADALTEAMDIDGLETLVRRLGDGDLRVVARDLTEPSPLAAEVLDTRPCALLDDEALAAVVAELEGFAAPAAAWESEILPARIVRFTPDMLDRLCLAGRASWARPAPPVRETPGRSFGPIRSTPIALFSRQGRRQVVPSLHHAHRVAATGLPGSEMPGSRIARVPRRRAPIRQETARWSLDMALYGDIGSAYATR